MLNKKSIGSSIVTVLRSKKSKKRQGAMDSFVTKSDFIVLRILFADEIEIEANNYLYPVFEPRELVITRKTFILRYWSPTEPDD
jgi:hypothetical protein